MATLYSGPPLGGPFFLVVLPVVRHTDLRDNQHSGNDPDLGAISTQWSRISSETRP
jgi:hypothetical protein